MNVSSRQELSHRALQESAYLTIRDGFAAPAKHPKDEREDERNRKSRRGDGIEGVDFPVRPLEDEMHDGKEIIGNRGDGDAFDGLPQFRCRDRRRFGILVFRHPVDPPGMPFP